jgi:ribonuclease T2
MRFAALLICAIAGLFSVSAHAEHHQRDQPGVFGYYLLNLSWEPEFCHSDRNAGSEECRAKGQGFVVHGLWPQFADGYPEHCSNAAGPRNLAQWLDLMPTTWLVEHEWSTHGTCSGLSPESYFGQIRRAYSSIHIPGQIKAITHTTSMTPAAIKQAFSIVNPGLRYEDMAISCGNNYLTAVEFCLSKKDLRFTSCGTLHECHANVVRIAPVRY